MTPVESQDSPVDWEGALVQRARAGDVRAFERLYREHVGRVYGLCLRMTRDAATAEDCTQETFINAWKALPRFEVRSSLATWLHRIAVNAALASLTDTDSTPGADTISINASDSFGNKAAQQQVAVAGQGRAPADEIAPLSLAQRRHQRALRL